MGSIRWHRLLTGLLFILCLMVPAPVLADTGPQITIGFLPLSTKADTVMVRGTAPAGQTVDIFRNGTMIARVVAGPSMSVYRYEVSLTPGENRITCTIEGTGVQADARVYQTDVTFRDMADHWAKEDVEILAALKVVNGVGPNDFGPDLPLTRAQFARLIVLGLGLKPSEQTAGAAFRDQASMPDWAAGYVQTAVAEKLLQGYADGSFQPDQPVTRAEVAVIAARALRYRQVQATGDPAVFDDQAAIPTWAVADTAYVTRARVIETSFWTTRFQPDTPATRAEAAAVVRRIMTR